MNTCHTGIHPLTIDHFTTTIMTEQHFHSGRVINCDLFTSYVSTVTITGTRQCTKNKYKGRPCSTMRDHPSSRGLIRSSRGERASVVLKPVSLVNLTGNFYRTSVTQGRHSVSLRFIVTGNKRVYWNSENQIYNVETKRSLHLFHLLHIFSH